MDLSLGALILLAPTLLVGTVYRMHSNHMPQLHWLLGYPLALLVMLVSSVSLHAKEAPSAEQQPGFPAPRRRPEPPAREQGLERWVRRLRRLATRSAVWGKEPTEKTRQTRTVRLPLKPLPSA